MKITHKGMYPYRLQSNPKEKVYAERWSELAEKYLENLLYGPNKHNETDELLQRDAIVAATVIQWLGSPIGQNFLVEVSEIINDPKKKKR